MEKQKKVVDASVLVKWFAKEEGTEKAIILRKEHEQGTVLLIVPDLAFLEVMNALTFKGNDQKTLMEALNSLWEEQLHVERLTKSLVEKAIINAKMYNLTVYDALYVTIASIHGCPLISDDKKMKKVPSVIHL